MPIIKFKPIKNNLPTENILPDLSTDKKYLLEIVQTVSLGKNDVSLLGRNLRKLLHVR